MPKVSVQIVTWNSERYLFNCLESLGRQTFTDFSVLVVDNGSQDGSVRFVRSHYPTAAVLENFKNLGYAKANDQGIALAKGQYVLVMNPDVVLDEAFLERLVAFADTHPDGASFTGKTLKLFGQTTSADDTDSQVQQIIKSDEIDSAGLEIHKTRKAINRGEGTRDTGQFDAVQEVFGASGSCVLYRRTALEAIKTYGEYFDHDFFAYKEDIDMAWRLRLAGWSAWYYPPAVCYHHRRFANLERRGKLKAWGGRLHVSKRLRRASFKNHHLLLVKNEQLTNVILGLPWLLLREIGLLSYSLILEPFQWRTIIIFFQQLPNALRKRRLIMAQAKARPREMRKWFK